MTAGLELFSFVLYVVQEAGVLLGVGAEMVLLTAYLLELHTPGAGEGAYAHAARFAERLALGLIVSSGLGAVALHAALGQSAVLGAPAFIGKWLLIGIVLVGYKFELLHNKRSTALQSAVRGIIGGTWLALFLLHIIAPDASATLITLGYVAWMLLFAAIWASFVIGMHRPLRKALRASISVPRVTAVALPKVTMPAMPKLVLPKIMAPTIIAPTVSPAPRVPVPSAPHADVPEVYKIELPAHIAKKIEPAAAPHKAVVAVARAPMPPSHPQPAPAPHKPAAVAAAPAPKPVAAAPAPLPPEYTDDQSLPAIRVMPRTPDDLARQNRGPALQF